jgi:hypothetical protein
MVKTPNGKIARLPRNIRDELNQRLENGEPADAILPWLNALPEVQAMLADQFAASPVNQQNLTNWRHGGYQYWLEGREHHNLVRELVQDAKEFTALPGAPDLARQMSTVFLAELVLSARKAQTELTDPAEQFERLRSLLHAVSQVRREDCLTERLALDRERQALRQERKLLKAAGRKNRPADPQLLQLLSELESERSQTAHPAPAETLPKQG